MNIKRNFKRKIYEVVTIILTCVLLYLILYNYKQANKASQIYYDSVQSVVELKASSTSVEDNYGTAVFINDEGLLITNMHVISYFKNGEDHVYDNLQIRFATEDEYRKVEFVKCSDELDIAVLQFKDLSKKVKGIPLGDSSEVDYGDKVYSVGNAMNYGLSISEGLVSAPIIEIVYDENIREVIQADINISSGNSGGALINQQGQLIGVTSFRIKDSSGEIVYGIGFSIPINKVIEYIGS